MLTVTAWRARRRVERLHGHGRERSLRAGADGSCAQWRCGLARTLEKIGGPPVAAMRDAPTQQKAPNHCLAKNPDAADRCATARTAAFDEPLVTPEADAVAASGADATYVDLTRYVCNDQTCPEIIGETVVFRDHHLTQAFSRSMAEPLWQQL